MRGQRRSYKLDFRAEFFAPDETGDRFGQIGAEVSRFERWVSFELLKGTERVQAERIEGRRPAIITVRRDEATREIGSDWSLKITGESQVFNVKEDPRATPDRAYLQFMVIGGEAP